MNWLELLKAAGVEIDAEKGEALNAALGAAVKEQIESSVMEATTGLKSKNDELLGKLKTQQTAAQEATAAAEAAARGQMSNDELNTLLCALLRNCQNIQKLSCHTYEHV